MKDERAKDQSTKHKAPVVIPKSDGNIVNICQTHEIII
jgi:hypothetical protein